MKLIRLLLWAICAASCCVRPGQAACSSSYQKIDEHLTAKVGVADASQNIDEATRWLKSEVEKRALATIRYKDLLKALNQFTTLATADQCNRDAYDTLSANQEQVRGEVDRCGRVAQVVRQVAVQHARHCLEGYARDFAAGYAELDNSVRYRLESLLDVIIDFDLKANRLRGALYGFAHGQVARLTEDAAETAFNALIIMAHNDPDANFRDQVLPKLYGVTVMSPHKIGHQLKRYMVEPCREYMAHLERQLFEPLSLDLATLTEDDRGAPSHSELTDSWNRMAATNSDLLFVWTRYRYCQALVADSGVYFDLGAAVSRLAAQEFRALQQG